MAKKSKGINVDAPVYKPTSCQHLERGERAQLGTTDINAYKNQYGKNPPASDEDFMSAFTMRK